MQLSKLQTVQKFALRKTKITIFQIFFLDVRIAERYRAVQGILKKKIREIDS